MKIRPTFSLLVILVALLGLWFLNCNKGKSTKLSVKYELEVKHRPVKNVISEEGAIAIVEIISSRKVSSNAVTLHYQVGETQKDLKMTPVDESIYQAEFSNYKKGTIVRYYIEVLAPDGTKVFLPKKAASGERFQFSFQGKISKELKVLYVTLAALVLLFFVLSFVVAFDYIKKGGSITKCIYISMIAAILLGIFMFPVGMAVHKIVYGTLFDGWPFGTGIAKTVLLLLLIGWALIFTGTRGTLLRRTELKDWFSDKTLASLVLAGSVLSFIFFIALLI